jgi:hypothetical protein
MDSDNALSMSTAKSAKSVCDDTVEDSRVPTTTVSTMSQHQDDDLNEFEKRIHRIIEREHDILDRLDE